METTLAILLYLNVICTCTYTDVSMNHIIEQNEPQIKAVENDVVLTEQIEVEYANQVTNIVIIDTEEQ